MKSLLTDFFKDTTRSYNENLDAHDENIRAKKDLCELLKKHNINDFNSFYNVSLYSMIISFDISILLNNIIHSGRKYESLLFARILALTLIEFMDDINSLIGHDLLNELENNNLNEFTNAFKAINKRYGTVKRNNQRLLRQIRNTSTAHKSKNSLELINHIEQLDVIVLANLGLEIIEITKDLTNETTKVAYKIKEIYLEKIHNSN